MSGIPAHELAFCLRLALQEFARKVSQVLARKTPHILLENSSAQKLDVSSVSDSFIVQTRKAPEPTVLDERRVQVVYQHHIWIVVS